MDFLTTYFRRLIFLLVIYSFSRLFFYLNNIDSIDEVRIIEFIEGIRFDISALVYINAPILFLLLFPANFLKKKRYTKSINVLFYLLNIPFLIINNIDIEYFRFTQRRSTFDFFQLLVLGEDAKNLIPQYLKNYWPITLFTAIQIWLVLTIRKIPKKDIIFNSKSILQRLIAIIIGIGLFIICARGGVQLKPINPINAGELSNSKNHALILNTPFCILHSLDEKPLNDYYYFNENEKNLIYSTNHDNEFFKMKKKNIIILIMESYSKEFVGFHNDNIGYTPFLDSLMQHSLVFTNAFSNGLKSIEALPAITASIPALTNNPFITSNYAQNNFTSLASILNKEGYNTSFFHGGMRGTMGFYSFSKKAKFSKYYGMEEYNNKNDYDGSWGIYDGPFIKYFSKTLNKIKEPFFSTFFSLSSHPPYNLPKDYYEEIKKNMKLSKIGIQETILYSDKCMRNFFNASKNQSWFKNTIFIITADHTSPTNYNKSYKNKIGRYAIPLVIFSGDSSIIGINNSTVQHIDIKPTILELLKYNKSFFSFGKSMFSEKSWAINYIQNEYRLITDSSIIINNKEKYLSYSDWNISKKNQIKLQNKRLLKAIKQDYNYRMLNNKLLYEN